MGASFVGQSQNGKEEVYRIGEGMLGGFPRSSGEGASGAGKVGPGGDGTWISTASKRWSEPRYSRVEDFMRMPSLAQM